MKDGFFRSRFRLASVTLSPAHRQCVQHYNRGFVVCGPLFSGTTRSYIHLVRCSFTARRARARRSLRRGWSRSFSLRPISTAAATRSRYTANTGTCRVRSAPTGSTKSPTSFTSGAAFFFSSSSSSTSFRWCWSGALACALPSHFTGDRRPPRARRRLSNSAKKTNAE